MRSLTTLLLLCILTACASPMSIPPTIVVSTNTVLAPLEPLTGDWIGAITKPDGSTASIVIHLNETEPILNIEPMTRNWKLDLSQTSDNLKFSTAGSTLDPFKEINFIGTYSSGNFSGEINWDGQTSKVTFTQIKTVDPLVLEKYEGVYRFESGRVLSIIVSPSFTTGGVTFFSNSLMLTDFDSGAFRGLYPLTEDTFAIGALRVVGAPFEGQIQFVKNDQGNIESLIWRDNSSAREQLASRVSIKYEDITFTSADGTKLAGRLSMPDTAEIFPVIMMLHGSEPGIRDNVSNKVMMHYMVSQGFAILNYDKRGVGASEGQYVEAASPVNLQRHADDANAGVQYLLTRPEIDAQKIGLIGYSQAGWVIPVAVSQSQNISFFVILSGPVASTAHDSKFNAYTSGGNSSSAQYDDAFITQQLRDFSPSGFDPLPVIAELEQNGLWLWGSVDKTVPATFCAENLQKIIDTGKDNFSYQILPNGDHGLNESQNGYFTEIPYSPKVLFYSVLTKWLEIHVLSSQE